MKIKIGDKTYTSEGQPIMAILSDSDKENIKNMSPECSKYCQWNDEKYTEEEIDEWIKG